MKYPVRIALAGASGTGKSTLANYLHERYGIPVNPVGSRSVARDMGFDSPYDVDKAGRRQEFQRLLVARKTIWEAEHESFITDRTTIDNLVYTMLHDVEGIDAEFFDACILGLRRYTHILWCPIKAMQNLVDDPQRKSSLIYHRAYEAALVGLFELHMPDEVESMDLADGDLDERQAILDHIMLIRS